MTIKTAAKTTTPKKAAKKSIAAVAEAEAEAPPKTFDFNTQRDRDAFRDFFTADKTGHKTDELYDRSALVEYLKTGEESGLFYGKDNLLIISDYTYRHSKNVVYCTGLGLPHDENGLYYNDEKDKSAGNYLDRYRPDSEDAEAVVLPYVKKRTEKNKGLKNLLLVNGDANEWGDESALVGELDEYDMPVASFRCLARFYDTDDAGLVKRLAAGTLKVIDYTPGNSIPLTAAEKKTKDNSKEGWKKLKPPEAGYSLISGASWHRSGSVLFCDEAKNMYILVGQDEGTYFGVELPGKVKTIADAYESLIPKAVKGQSYKRQGEWFMVPVDPKAVPETKDCVLQFDNCDYAVFLPLDTPESNRHTLISDDGRVGPDGTVYVKSPRVTHDEHAELSGTGWYTFHKNTAKRAFSEQGVD